MKRAVVAVVLLVASVASVSGQGPGQQPEGYPAPGAPAMVTLVSAGAAPRAALRYIPPAGFKQHADMTMAMSMAMEVGGNSMPSTSMPVVTIGSDFVVTEVAPSGDVTYTIAFTGVTTDASGDPAMAAQLQGMGDALKSVKGSATISSRGILRTSNFDLGTLANSPVGQMMGSSSDVLKQSSIPVPEEEVGVGARWEVRNALNSNGLMLFQKTVYELVASDGKTLTLKTTLEQTAPPQAVSNPALPAGAEVHIERYSGGGSGTMRVNVNELVPTSEGTLENTTVMNVNMGGMAQQMLINTSVKLTVAPGK